MHLPQMVKKAIHMLNAAGHRAYAVGGCVRDAVMGIAPHDFDLASSATPEEMLCVFRGSRVIETGLKHGTVTVLMDGMPIEITTFRSAQGFARTLEEDLAHRDLTMNAMAYHPDEGVVDPFGGRADIENGVIRCVADAQSRILEDPLRMLRAARFASVFGFAIEQETQNAIDRHRDLLAGVSAERLASELIKLLCGRDVRRVLMEQVRLIGAFIPELLPMEGFDQKNHHHIYTVLEHTAAAVENIPATPVLRLAMLLHDIGKPPCFQIREDGEGHFYGHAAKSTEMAQDILARLKLDNHTRERVTLLVKYHDHVIEPSAKAVKRMLLKLGEEAFDELVLVKRADNLAQHPDYRSRQQGLDELVRVKAEIMAQSQCFSLKDLALGGRDLLALGVRPGPEIGRTLEKLLDAVVAEEVENTREALEKAAASILLQGGNFHA